MSPDRTEPQGGRISLESADLAELLDRVSADSFAAGRDAVYEHEKAGLVTAPWAGACMSVSAVLIVMGQPMWSGIVAGFGVVLAVRAIVAWRRPRPTRGSLRMIIALPDGRRWSWDGRAWQHMDAGGAR